MWVATDWPVGALGAGYLLFVHQLQYVLLVMVAPPLILLGTPRWVCQSMVDSPAVRPVARVVTRPLIAIVICNAVVLLTHFPELVDVLMPTQIGSFLIDIAWLLAGFLLWWPALRRVEEPNALSYPARFGYLLAATLLPAVPAAFFFFANYPIYSTYELAPPIGTLAATDDQFVGGAVMKLGSLVVVVFALTVIFFQWHAADRSPDGRIVLPRSVMDT
jgi:putative membrane protein